MQSRYLAVGVAVVLAAACGDSGTETSSPTTTAATTTSVVEVGPSPDPGFGTPQEVTIRGYDGHAMEPFLTRGGRYLLFNNRNDPATDTNLHYAERIDDITFEYRGEIEGANSTELDAVATVSESGELFFVSLRTYVATSDSLFSAAFHDGAVTDIVAVTGLNPLGLGSVNFDVEVSPDGSTLYYVESIVDDDGPTTANLAVAVRREDGFERAADSDSVLAGINTAAWEYAAAISSDGRELFFTRLDRETDEPPRIYYASRDGSGSPFAAPVLLDTLDGYVEAPTLTPDEKGLYYHKLEDNRFVIYLVTRP